MHIGTQGISLTAIDIIMVCEIRAGVSSSVPAGVHWQIFSVVSIFLILFKVQLSQKLAGLHHRILSVGQNSIRPVHLNTQHFTLKPLFLQKKSLNSTTVKTGDSIHCTRHITLKSHTSATYTSRKLQHKYTPGLFNQCNLLCSIYFKCSHKTHTWKLQLIHKNLMKRILLLEQTNNNIVKSYTYYPSNQKFILKPQTYSYNTSVVHKRNTQSHTCDATTDINKP